jgi:hypothetical protein
MTLEDANFRELNFAMRHFSNLRFLIIPIYLTINGAMFLGLDRNFGIDPLIPNICMLTLALIIFGVFYYLENALNRYLDAFYLELVVSYPNNSWRRRPKTYGWVHRPICIMYIWIAVDWFILIASRLYSHPYCNLT